MLGFSRQMLARVNSLDSEKFTPPTYCYWNYYFHLEKK